MNNVNDMLFQLNLLNWYLFGVEIENGLIFCSSCNRWYPIDETIPQMLPDELRRDMDEIKFLSDWKELIPELIIKQGIPYNLKKN